MKYKIDTFFQEFQNKVMQIQANVVQDIGTAVVNDSLENFEKQAFTNNPWPKRKNKKDQSRALLVKSGRLRRSVRVIASSPTSVTIGSDVPYAGVHNDGGMINRAARSETFVRNRHKRGKLGKMFGGMGAFRKGTTPGKGLTFKAYSYNMPRRRFLGMSTKLHKEIREIIRTEFETQFNK